jgi:hypothetical protein
MNRMLIGGIVAAIVLFAWGVISWMFIPWHAATFSTLPHEDLLMQTLGDHLSESGVYWFPNTPADMSDAAAVEAFNEKHRAGPLGVLFFQARGSEPMSRGQFVVGFILTLASALVAAAILSAAAPQTPQYSQRVAIVTAMGVLVGLAAYLPAWNWMLAPPWYTLVMCADTVIGFFLAGLPMALIIRS